MGTLIKQGILKGRGQMASEYMKTCSTFLFIKEMQIETALRFPPQLEWPESGAITTTNVGEDVVKQEPLHTAGGNAN
jgi:hypothetical protein